MTKTRITGVIDEIMRMKSSASGNPRYVVTINGTHYRTIPDSDFAYEVPNLVGKHVELFLRHYHGREQIMYGGEYPTPVLAGNKPEDNTPVTSPEAVFQRLRREETTENEHAFLLGFYERLAMNSDALGRTHPTDQDWNIAYDNGRAMAQAVHNQLTGQEEE